MSHPNDLDVRAVLMQARMRTPYYALTYEELVEDVAAEQGFSLEDFQSAREGYAERQREPDPERARAQAIHEEARCAGDRAMEGPRTHSTYADWEAAAAAAFHTRLAEASVEHGMTVTEVQTEQDRLHAVRLEHNRAWERRQEQLGLAPFWSGERQGSTS